VRGVKMGDLDSATGIKANGENESKSLETHLNNHR
jgi:hypothetical protein